MRINRHILDNGLRLVHSKDETTQMVALNVLYNVGARDEHPEHTGFAHLFEHKNTQWRLRFTDGCFYIYLTFSHRFKGIIIYLSKCRPHYHKRQKKCYAIKNLGGRNLLQGQCSFYKVQNYAYSQKGSYQNQYAWCQRQHSQQQQYLK